MSRGFQAALTAACFAFMTLMTPPVAGFGVSDAQAESSDRMGGGGGKKAAGRTTVKSSKSNTSDRMGGGGGKGQASRGILPGFGAGQLNPQPEPPGRGKAK
jgi:hypothetical protein